MPDSLMISRGLFAKSVLMACLLDIAIPANAQVRSEDALVSAVKVATPPTIDGRLDEPLWEEIDPITDFSQWEPGNGVPPSERTEVRICYDDRFLYFGIRAYDSEPSKIIARVFERDGIVDFDDAFTVAIDSMNDNRTAVLFNTNVLGTKSDVQYAEVGVYNSSWDSIWYTKGNIDELGYTIETAIPFFSLRFKPAETVEMGLYFERVIRRKSEKVTWPHLTRDYNYRSVSQYGRLMDLKGIGRGVDLEVKPYGITGFNETVHQSGYEADVGVDVKWGMTTNLTTDLTLNPDFAQVESDALQINLSRFNLFYPEKREFFLENADLFQFGLPKNAEVFFSRRIGIRGGDEMPIIGGARTYGMAGRTNIGLMTMQTRESAGFGGENFSVARVKHNILDRSYVGGIVTSRKGEAELEDTTFGGDFKLLFGTNFKIEGGLARSNRPGIDDGNWMGNLSVRQDTDLYDWVVSYDDIGRDFAPGIGFVLRPDQRNLGANAHYKPRPDWKGVRQLTFGHLYRRIENHNGVLETQTFRPGFLTTFQTEDRFTTQYEDTFDRVPHSFPIAPGVTIPAGEYTNRQFSIEFNSNRSRPLSTTVSYRGGSYYGGDIWSTRLAVIYKPRPRLHLSTEQSLDKVDVPGGSFDSLISTLQASYYFSPTLTTRLAVQYASLLDDFVFNFRLRWIYAPRSEAWLVYDEFRRFDLVVSSLQDRALIFKVVHNFKF